MINKLLIILLLAFSQTPGAPQTPDASRLVKDQVLSSTQLPAIRIKFDDKLEYVGSQKFILYGRAHAEQFFFVEADDEKRIKRMYFVQFEGYLPNINATYNYSGTETVTLAGQPYLVNAETVPNVSDVLKANPESDAARAVTFLQGKGYQMNQSVKFQRFVRLVDEAKRNEIILIYIEDAATGEKPDKEFLARALKGFTVLE